MQRVFRLALVVHDLRGDLRGLEATMQNVGITLCVAFVGRENEVTLVFSRCSRSTFTSIGGRGTVRSPAADFGSPISRNRSARSRTCSFAPLRSTFFHRRPR